MYLRYFVEILGDLNTIQLFQMNLNKLQILQKMYSNFLEYMIVFVCIRTVLMRLSSSNFVVVYFRQFSSTC